MSSILDVRPSPIAGRWYSGDPAELAAEVDGYLSAVRLPPLEGELIGLIAPHAGYRYSGKVAAHAFRAVQGRVYDLVVVLSPMHQAYPQAFLTSAHQAYHTPLGDIEIDREAVARLDAELTARAGVGLTAVTRDPEHSLEIELPFLQRSLAGPFRLLPVMCRAQTPASSRYLGEAIAETIRDRSALLVASTDLSHFYPLSLAEELDRNTLDQIEAFSPEKLYEAARAGEAFACGLNAVAAVLWASQALGARKVQILRYATSADETGDTTSVVGYAAAVITK